MKPYLNIGCGRDIMPDAINIDTVAGPGVDVLVNLEEEQLPFEENSFEGIYANHILEHLGEILTVMQELYRVAKAGCHLLVRTPHVGSNDAHDDPTHVRYFTETSWAAYCQPYYWRATYYTTLDERYTADWKCIGVQLLVQKGLWSEDATIEQVLEACHTRRNQVLEMRADLIAIKPAREAVRSLQEPYPIDVALIDP